MAGPANGSSVTVKKASGEIVAGPVTTAADGTYTVAIPDSALTSDLIFTATGGTFTDEATAANGVSMGTMTTHMSAGSLVSGVHITIDPSSTIIQKLIAGGKTKAAAESDFAKAFGYTPDCSVKPVFAGMSTASTATQRLSGLRTAAFSQMAKDLSLAPDKQFELVNALAADLADGTLDGGQAVGTTTLPADICNKYGQALMTFQNSSNNKSKLTFDKIGAPPFAKKALTPSYIVDYIPGMAAAAQGKTSFKVKISNRDGSAATGKSVTLMPLMHMASMSHSAPVDTVVESATPGTYDCTVYYSMASGPGMGVWELKVMIGMESALFYPPVAMAMGTTSFVKLKGIDDKIGSMGSMTSRTYQLFNDGISGGTIKLFVSAADDSMMMKFPAVSGGTILTGLTVNTISVEVSSDPTNSVSWTALTDGGNGHWSASGITPDMNSKINVRLTINGEQKTTDGKVLSTNGLNGYQTFIIVSGSGMAM
jgi:hypothetical protein